MRTSKSNEAQHVVNGVITVSGTCKEIKNLLVPLSIIIRRFINETPWTNGKKIPESLKVTMFERDEYSAYVIEPHKQLRNGQLRAYENRLKEIRDVVRSHICTTNYHTGGCRDPKVKIVITKPLD